jgi:hypothetical protein
VVINLLLRGITMRDVELEFQIKQARPGIESLRPMMSCCVLLHAINRYTMTRALRGKDETIDDTLVVRPTRNYLPLRER